MNWRPDHRGIMTLWHNEQAIAAISPLYDDDKTTWYWHTYINAQNGFCHTLWQAQAKAERSVSPHYLH